MNFESKELYYTITAYRPKNKTFWISSTKFYLSTIRKVEILNNLLYLTTRLKCGISDFDNMTIVLYFDNELELKRIYNDLLKFVS